MRLLKLKEIELIYSNIKEDEYPEWSDSITYAKENKVIVADTKPHKIYESLVDDNIGNYPPDSVWKDIQAKYEEWSKKTTYSAGDRVKVSYAEDGVTELDKPIAFESLISDNNSNYPPNSLSAWKCLNMWKEISSTNRWKMFDSLVLSQTENEGKIEVVVDFGNCDGFALFNLYAHSVEWYLYDGDYTDPEKLVKSGVIDNLQEPVLDWYEYFYFEIYYKQDVCVMGLPLLPDGKLKVVINPLSGIAKCGMMVVGRSRKLGDTMFNVRTGIIDFSVKKVDEKGNAKLKEGKFAKLIECDIWLESRWIDIVRKELASVRATPAVYNFNNDDMNFDSLVVYGFFKDFDVVLSNPTASKCSIQIEGLI